MNSGCNRSNSHITNAGSNWVAMGVDAIIAFFLTPMVVYYLGQEGYGLWALIISIIGYYGFLDLGVSSAIQRYVARYAARKDNLSLNSVVSTSLVFFLVVGIAVVFVTFITATPLVLFFDVPPGRYNDFVQAIQLLGFAMSVRLVGNVYLHTLIAHEQFVAANFAVIFCSILRAIMTLLLLNRGLGLLGVAVSHVLSGIVSGLLFFIICRCRLPTVRFSILSVNRTTLRSLLVFGGITTIIAITNTVRLNLDSFIIAKMIDLRAVGVFAVAALLTRYAVQLVVSAMGVFTPRFAALDGLGNKYHLNQVFLKSLFVCSVMAFFFASLLVAFGANFIRLWVGEDFLGAVPVLLVLAVGHAVASSQNVCIGMMYAIKKHNWYAASSTIEAICNLALSIALAPRYGVVGVALGTAIPMVAIRAVAQPVYVSRLLGIPVTSYYAYFLPGLFVGSGPVGIVAFLGSKIFMSASYLSLAGQALSSSVVILTSLVLFRSASNRIQQIGPWNIGLQTNK